MDYEITQMRKTVHNILSDRGSLDLFRQLVAKSIRENSEAPVKFTESRVKYASELIDTFVMEYQNTKVSKKEGESNGET